MDAALVLSVGTTMCLSIRRLSSIRGGGERAGLMSDACRVAARQLVAYNQRAATRFLCCFAMSVELRELETNSVKLCGDDFSTRYRTVFTHSPGLRASVSLRVSVVPARGDARWSYAIDFERYAGLVSPIGSALDGSNGLLPASGADIVVMYRCSSCSGDAGNAAGSIDRLWAALDREGVGRAGTVDAVLASAALQRCLSRIGAEQSCCPSSLDVRVVALERSDSSVVGIDTARIDLDWNAVSAFAARVRDGDRVALLVDYDLTISRGSAVECHHLLRDSAACSAAFRADLAQLFATIDAQTAALEPRDPRRAHLFWEQANALLVAHGVTRSTLESVVAREKARAGALLRDGWSELLALCAARSVPVVILSAGLAGVIRAAHAAEGIALDPAHTVIVSSELTYDATGRCVAVAPRDPPCSRVGKLAHLARDPRAVALLEGRDAVVVVGDMAVDATMANGYPPLASGRAAPALLRFGFLNYRGAEAREGGVELLRATRDAYEAAYDVLPAGAGDDESFAHISAFLRAVLPSP